MSYRAKISELKRIKEMVCAEFDVSMMDLISERTGNKYLYTVRQIAYFLCRDLTPASLPRIGRAFSDRDHTTIMHGIRIAQDNVKRYPDIHKRVDKIKKAFNDEK